MKLAILRCAAVAAVLTAAACAAPNSETAQYAEDQTADGMRIAQTQCGTCHATGSEGASPRPDAPPLREAVGRYRLDVLQEELLEGIKLGHPDMPKFQFEPQGVDALVAYLKTIRVEPAEGEAQ